MIERRCSMLLASAVCLTTLLGGPSATSANAAPVPLGEACTIFGCSSVVNDSSYYISALKNWCRGGDHTGDTIGIRPNCGHQDNMFLGARGGHTPYNEDWDVLQVDAGWCYKVKFVVSLGRDFTRSYNRRGRGPQWVKVEDDADAHVLAQAMDRCP